MDNYVTFSFSKERAIVNLKLKQTWSQCSDPFHPVVSQSLVSVATWTLEPKHNLPGARKGVSL